MALNLSIIKSPAGVSLSSSEMVFSEQGGTIGRGEGNDWVLGDPDRFLSSRHCTVSYQGGQYFLIDTSTNGTFVNGAAEPLGKGSKISIGNGDTIELGDYQFRVEVQGEVSDPFKSPSDDPFSNDSFAQASQSSDSLDPFAPPSGAASADPFAGDPFSDMTASDPFSSGGGGSFGGNDPFSSSENSAPGSFGASFEDLSLDADPLNVDPLAALDNMQGNSANPQKVNTGFDHDMPSDVGNDFDDLGLGINDGMGLEPPSSSRNKGLGANSYGDQSGALNQAVDWPDAQSESVIPEDWDDDLMGGSDDLMGVSSPQLEPSSAPVSPPPQRQTPNLDLSQAHRSMPLTEPPKSRPAPVQKQEPLLAERRPEGAQPFQSRQAPPPKEAPGRGAKAQQKPQARHDSPASDAADAVLEGLGLSQRELSEEQKQLIYETIGELIPVIIGGMMQILRSRASIKNEFRMNVTTIQPIENNPLKFSADISEAVENMFLRQSHAYLGATESFEEGFNGIGEHQVAIIAGIRAAFKSMMDRFNPELLERQFEKQNKGSILPGMQKAKYWNNYVDHYKGFVDNMENTFQYLFGDEFVQAYEEQLRRLAAERKKRQ